MVAMTRAVAIVVVMIVMMVVTMVVSIRRVNGVETNWGFIFGESPFSFLSCLEVLMQLFLFGDHEGSKLFRNFLLQGTGRGWSKGSRGYTGLFLSNLQIAEVDWIVGRDSIVEDRVVLQAPLAGDFFKFGKILGRLLKFIINLYVGKIINFILR